MEWTNDKMNENGQFWCSIDGSEHESNGNKWLKWIMSHCKCSYMCLRIFIDAVRWHLKQKEPDHIETLLTSKWSNPLKAEEALEEFHRRRCCILQARFLSSRRRNSCKSLRGIVSKRFVIESRRLWWWRSAAVLPVVDEVVEMSASTQDEIWEWSRDLRRGRQNPASSKRGKRW